MANERPHWPLRPTPNGHRPPETGGKLGLLQRAGLKEKCFLELKSVLLEVGYIEKWPKFAYLESKFPHLKFRVMRDLVYYAVCLGQQINTKLIW